jgi:hypothetical protein
VLLPPEHPAPALPLELFPPIARQQIEAWRARPAGRFALQLYARERASTPRAA